MTSKRPSKATQAGMPVLLLLAIVPASAIGPWSILWTAPAILLASMMIAWGAESAQFFMAQGFALAILAWLQTLPEFAVEADLAYRQKTPLLLANLTGALRLLTGLGWPMIYATAAAAHRLKYRKPLGRITLVPQHSVQVVGLLACMAYAAVIWWRGTLNLFDSAVLVTIYAAYLWVLQRLPAETAEGVEELGAIPRGIVKASKSLRILGIAGLFALGGGLIFFLIDPFLVSLEAIATALGMSTFIFIQWVAPFVSEFPEKVSAFYWAKTIDRASVALMNMVSSNVNQWTLLAAMLPIVLSMGRGSVTALRFDSQQSLEFLMTLGQSLIGSIFLMNMELVWWEAGTLFALWVVQFVLSLFNPGPGVFGFLTIHIHWYVTIAYLAWSAVEIVRMLLGRRSPLAFRLFAAVWRKHVR